jgi:ABC-type transporter Mla subunit MlaD
METKPELRETMQNVRLLTARMDTLTYNINAMVENAQDTNSTVGKLLNEDEVYENVNQTLVSINKLIKKIEKDGIRLKIF